MSKNKKKFNIADQTNTPKTELTQQDIINHQIEVLKKKCYGKSLLILMPIMNGFLHSETSKTIKQITLFGERLGVRVEEANIIGESLLPRSRSYLLQSFLDSGFTHALWLDSDIGVNYINVFEMLALQGDVDAETNKTYDVIGIPYAKKNLATDKILQAVLSGLVTMENHQDILNYSADLVINPLPIEGKQSINFNRPILVKEVGTGIMLYSREVIEKVIKDNPEKVFKPDHARVKGFDGSRMIPDMFPVYTDENLRLLSEDYAHLKLLEDSGFNTWILPHCTTTHHGSFAYKANPIHLATLFNKISDEYYTSFSGPLVKKPEKTSENP